jgi:hypothetical protein
LILSVITMIKDGELVHTLSNRIAGYLEGAGILTAASARVEPRAVGLSTNKSLAPPARYRHLSGNGKLVKIRLIYHNPISPNSDGVAY